MPGFRIDNAEGVSNVAESRRKHRWVFAVLGPSWTEDGLLFLKSASRPKFTFEEPMIHHDQEQAYFAGKQSWEAITLTWYDIEQDPDISSTCYSWLNTVVTIDSAVVDIPSNYKVDSQLQMTNGAGQATETWVMHGTWPKEVNWGELAYDDTEIATVEAVIRFDRAKRTD